MYDDPIVKQEVEAAQTFAEFVEAAQEFLRAFAEAAQPFIESVQAFAEAVAEWIEEMFASFRPVLLWIALIVNMAANREAAARRRKWRRKASMVRLW